MKCIKKECVSRSVAAGVTLEQFWNERLERLYKEVERGVVELNYINADEFEYTNREIDEDALKRIAIVQGKKIEEE